MLILRPKAILTRAARLRGLRASDARRYKEPRRSWALHTGSFDGTSGAVRGARFPIRPDSFVALLVLLPSFHLVRALLILCGLGFVTTAGAEQEAIRLDYSAPAGCPTPTDFRKLVFERTRGARPAVDGETARAFVVTVRKRGRSLEGTLVVREAEATFARTVHGSDCVEIATVLALATALAIDPRAELDSHMSEPTPFRPSQLGAAQAEAEERAVAEEPEANDWPSVGREQVEPSDRVSPAERSQATSSTWQFGVSLGPQIMVAATPRPAWGGVLAFDARSGEQPLQWGLAIGVLQTPDKVVQAARANFQFLLAAPELCMSIWKPAAGARLSPCLGAQVGLITGRGEGIAIQRTARRYWGSVVLGLKFEASLSRVWFTSLSAGAGFPFTRYRFEFDSPQTAIYLAPQVVGTSTMRIGARF